MAMESERPAICLSSTRTYDSPGRWIVSPIERSYALKEIKGVDYESFGRSQTI